MSGSVTFTLSDGTVSGVVGDFNNLGVGIEANPAYPNVYAFFTPDVTLTGDFPCFAAGTLLASPEGPVEVSSVAPGDLLGTADGVAQPVRWVGHRHARDATVIRLSAGCMGAGVPSRDLLVSDDHGILVDGVLVPAGLLVNGTTILEERRESVVFYHVELERHAILLAEGAPAESYLDTGNRAQFGNCPLTYDPVMAYRADACAELVVAGARLEEARASLMARTCQPAA